MFFSKSTIKKVEAKSMLVYNILSTILFLPTGILLSDRIIYMK